MNYTTNNSRSAKTAFKLAYRKIRRESQTTPQFDFTIKMPGGFPTCEAKQTTDPVIYDAVLQVIRMRFFGEAQPNYRSRSFLRRKSEGDFQSKDPPRRTVKDFTIVLGRGCAFKYLT